MATPTSHFVGLTVLLGGLFAVGVLAAEALRPGSAGRTRTVTH